MGLRMGRWGWSAASFSQESLQPSDCLTASLEAGKCNSIQLVYVVIIVFIITIVIIVFYLHFGLTMLDILSAEMTCQRSGGCP